MAIRHLIVGAIRVASGLSCVLRAASASCGASAAARKGAAALGVVSAIWLLAQDAHKSAGTAGKGINYFILALKGFIRLSQ